jgi:hypothetical protein
MLGDTFKITLGASIATIGTFGCARCVGIGLFDLHAGAATSAGFLTILFGTAVDLSFLSLNFEASGCLLSLDLLRALLLPLQLILNSNV